MAQRTKKGKQVRSLTATVNGVIWLQSRRELNVVRLRGSPLLRLEWHTHTHGTTVTTTAATGQNEDAPCCRWFGRSDGERAVILGVGGVTACDDRLVPVRARSWPERLTERQLPVAHRFSFRFETHPSLHHSFLILRFECK